MDPQPVPIPTPQPIPPPPPPAPPPPKNSPWMILWVGVVLLLGIAIGLLINNKSLISGFTIPGLAPTPTPTTIPTPSPTPDPTANWKTYIDTTNGFSLKYPDTYFKFQGDPTLGFFIATSATQGGNGPKFLPNKNDVWLGESTLKTANYSNLNTLDQYITSIAIYENPIKTSITMDGVNAYKIVYSSQVYCAGNSCSTIYGYDELVLKNGNIYVVTMSSGDKSTLDNNANLFDQILSTFKFTDTKGASPLTSPSASTTPEATYVPSNILVLFNAGVTYKQAKDLFNAYGITSWNNIYWKISNFTPNDSTILKDVDSIFAITVPIGKENEFITKFLQSPLVNTAELDNIIKTGDCSKGPC